MTAVILKKPVKVHDLLSWVPHRAPMIWLDEITDFSETACSARITLKGDGLYMEPGGLRLSSCLEFIAQSYGYGSACFKLQRDGSEAKPVLRGFLASFKDVQFAPLSQFQGLKAGQTLSIHVTGIRQKSSITLLHGTVNVDGAQLCQADLKIFTANDA